MHYELYALLLLALFLNANVSASTCISQKSPGDTSLCNKSGRVKDKYEGAVKHPYYVSTPQYVNSVEECAALCARRRYSKSFGQTEPSTWCRSINFLPDPKVCQLGWTTVATGVDTQPIHADRGKFYDLSCFDCDDDPCAKPFNTPLLDNSAFEAPLFGPWRSDSGSLGKGYHSKRAWKCGPYPGSGYVSCALNQQINHCPGSLYYWRWRYKANNDLKPGTTFAGGTFDAKQGGYYDSFRYSRTIRQPIDWRTAYGFSYKNIDTNLLLTGPDYFGTYGQRDPPTWYIDDVTYMRVDPDDFKTDQQVQIFKNPGFDSGDISPWVLKTFSGCVGNYTIVQSGAGNSGYALRFLADGNHSRRDSCLFQQTINIKPDTAYLFEVELEVADPFFFRVLEINYGDLTYFPYYNGSSNHLALRPGRNRYSIPIVPFTMNNSAMLQFGFILPERGRTEILLDNFSLREITNFPY